MGDAVQVYDIAASYDWNYDHAPIEAPCVDVPPVPGAWEFCGLRVNSPLGMPAGPLLNSRWIAYYAALGFDVLTYKTVRSRYRRSYDPPNLLPIAPGTLADEGGEVCEGSGPYGSWAISFGMPSKDPTEWRDDVGKARAALGPGQALVVSVVASPEPGWTIGDLAADFAQCAAWAAESGADAVEANLSCPNVCTSEADLFLDPPAAGEIAGAVRQRIGGLPLLIKVGLFPHAEIAEALVKAVAPFVDGIAATNSITAKVRGADGKLMFDGLRRGIGGDATTARCLEEIRTLRRFTEGTGVRLVGVGGVTTAQDVRDRLAAGASAVHLATAPMIDPLVGVKIRKDLA